jgi:glucose dehydrogenase
MSACKGCGAAIVWAKTANNRAIPLDAKTEKRFWLADSTGIAVLLTTYTPHHATCPNVAQFRKGPKSQ